ncbi:MAG: hypothetical protein HY077_03540 [Elusimicrobia bacterium]|nr:hypothetical protein [Elusimicrobiota bacterium]
MPQANDFEDGITRAVRRMRRRAVALRLLLAAAGAVAAAGLWTRAHARGELAGQPGPFVQEGEGRLGDHPGIAAGAR